MSPVENFFDDMLLTFMSKSCLGVKQLQEQLQQCWPVASSASCMQQLWKEIQQEMKQALEEVNFHHEDKCKHLAKYSMIFKQ